jgi:hypothetical protein
VICSVFAMYDRPSSRKTWAKFPAFLTICWVPVDIRLFPFLSALFRTSPRLFLLPIDEPSQEGNGEGVFSVAILVDQTSLAEGRKHLVHMARAKGLRQ